MSRQVVYIVCAEGEEALAEQLANPLTDAGYVVAHNGTIAIGESRLNEAEKAVSSGAPIILCATARAIGSGWSHRIVSAAQSSSVERVFVVQMERQAYVGLLALDGRTARYCDDPKQAIDELLESLARNFPPVLHPDLRAGPKLISREVIDPDRQFLDQVTELTIFDINALDQFRAELRAEVSVRYPPTMTAWDFLSQESLWIDGKLTLTGALLFAKNPAAACPASMVKCTRYNGDDRTAPREIVTLDGTVPSQIIAARQFVADRVSIGEAPRPDQAQLSTVHAYPMIAVREIIANALVHRDYAASDACVHVRLFADRLEVSSPGTWIGRDLEPGLQYELGSLIGQSKKRNYRLAHILSFIRLVEGEGSGIPAALKSCEEALSPVPQVSLDDGFVTVVLRRRELQELRASSELTDPRAFPVQVELVTRLDVGPDATIDRRAVVRSNGGELDYLVVLRPGAPMRCIGVVDGAADAGNVDELDRHIFAPLRTRGAAELVVVHHGPDDLALRARYLERGIRVKTWTEYNNLLETGAYRRWLQGELAADRLYPQELYQPQRYRRVDRFGRAASDRSEDLAREIRDAFLSEEGRFVLVLGDAGFGKSFLVRHLAYQLLSDERSLTPIIISLRDRDKRQSIDEMASAAMLPSRATFQVDRFRHSLEAGTLALLVDGYDEFAVKVGYANAAAQLRTFTEALRGRAKIMLTTRPSHFRSTDDITASLFDDVRTVHQGRVYQLEPFDPDQQRNFLRQWFDLAGQQSPDQLAAQWMGALAAVENLPELARTPRMLTFVVEELSLSALEQAADQGAMTAASLYQALVTRWLTAETQKIDPYSPGTITQQQRQDLLEELALHLWRTGERDVTEGALQHAVRAGLDLPRLQLTLDQAAQEIGGRTLLQVDAGRWRFVHQSVWEFLLARRLARVLSSGQHDDVLGEAQLTGLTIRFLRDLEPEATAAWAKRVVHDEQP